MNEPVAKRRRWFRYSLRTMLVAVTLLCVWLGAVVNPARRQRQTVEKLRESTGRAFIRYDYEDRGSTNPRAPDWLRRLLGDDYFHDVVSLTWLHFHADEVTPDDLVDLPKLRDLTLREMPITDEGLQKLARLRRLESLCIDTGNSRDITDHGLEHLSSLIELENLTVRSIQITGEGLRPLTALKKLRSLSLRSDSISLRGLEIVVQFTNLDSLRISSNNLTDEGLRALAKLEGLTNLWVEGNNITDEGLKHIARLSNLQQLTVNSRGITDAGLAHLAPLSKLLELDVLHRRPSYTERGVEQLHAQLPKLTVKYDVMDPVSGQPVGRRLAPAPKTSRKSR